MSIRRVITDVPVGDVPFVSAMIASDNGKIIEQIPEADGQVTLIAVFPDPAKADSTNESKAALAVAVPKTTVPLMAADWMSVARAEFAKHVKEVPGNASNPQIEAYHATTSGGAADDSVPWCSSFVNYCVTTAGGRGTNSKAARSWMTWGKDAGEFADGCIVVLQRGAAPNGHVGFFVGFDGDRIQLLGGNQGDAVSIASFERSRTLARRLAV